MANPNVDVPGEHWEPIFLTVDDVMRIHEDQIRRYGGDLGTRDMGLLESAVSQPQAGFGDEYLHKTVFEMAAAYVFHIAMNHPFVDGNKRAGAMAAYTFLMINRYDLDANETEFEDLVLRTASGEVEKPEIARFFERNCLL